MDSVSADEKRRAGILGYNAFVMLSIFNRLSSWPKRYLLGALFLACWLLGMAVLHQLLSDLPNIETLQNYTPPIVTRIYDIHGDIVSELFTERRTLIPLTEIPVNLQNAFLATEDQYFFQHWGINLRGIFRASLTNLRHGRVVEGGSTITQQLSKVLFFSQTKTLSRKIREFLLALQLERNYSKEEIFQLYLNQIYFGHGAYGVEAAARTFFGKHVKDLNLAECATLAGLPRSPRTYSPFLNSKNALRRRAWVLSRLRRSGYITPQEEMIAGVVPLNTQKSPVLSPTGAYFVEYLRQILEPKYGDNALYQGGFSIYTTLDVKMQRAAEEVMNRYLADFDKEKEKEKLQQLADFKKHKKAVPLSFSTSTVKVQGSLVAIDPRTGGIRAMVGGRDYRESQFNRVTQAQRQPGSAFKPFVWTAAMDDSMTAATIVDDDRVAFYNDGQNWKLLESATDAYAIAAATAPYPPDQVWVPQNWDFKYFGPVTLRTGIALSRNLVSIRLTDHFGAPAVVDYARRCGIKSPLQPVLSIALGTEQVNLLELTDAYATFANGGIRPEPYGIIRLEDKNGKVLEEHSPTSSVELSAQTAYLMADLLRAAVTHGTGARAQAVDRPAAGKTGTNQDLKDLWFVGFTPDLVAGAWMGYDDFTSLGKHFTAASKVVPWWTEFMKQAHDGIPAHNFPVPEDIVFAKIDAQTGLLALPSCPKVVLAAFKKGTDPKDLCPVDHLSQQTKEIETEE
jgi:penicillin-binding protein 1A